MLQRSARLGFTALALVAGAMPVLAQGTQTGNLAGVVKDAVSGKAIAGATVVAKTPQGDRSVLTDAQGAFRFVQLIPGSVQIVVTAQGFKGAQIATRVNLGETNITDFPLRSVSDATATVEVVATANNIDTSDAHDGKVISLEKINDLPINQRTVTNIASLAPGVSFDANGLTIRGAQNTQVLYLVDGADVADPVTGGFAAQLNEDMLSDVQVISGGVSAEYGRFTGGVVNTITRSGSNEFSGVVRFTASNPNWNAYNPLNRGLAGTTTFKDTHNVQQNFVFSGPILKDKLFFVVGYRAQAPFARSTSAQTTADPAYGGGIPYQNTQTDQRKDIKLDWQITPTQRLFWQYNKTQIDVTGIDYTGAFLGGSTSLATLSNQPNSFSYYTLGYQGQLTSDMVLDLHYGYKKETLGGKGGGGQGPSNYPLMIDLNTFYAYDNGFFGADGDARPIRNGSVSLLTFFRGAGEHELKAGLDWYESSHSAANSQTPSGMLVYFGGFTVDPAAGGSTDISNRIFVPNDPSQTFLDQWITYEGATTKNTILAAYINDKWKINSHWSVNLGLRADKFTSKDDLGASNFDLTTISPRFGAIWDIRGNGSWVTQLTFGEYVGAINQGATDGASVVGNPAEYDYAYVGGDPRLRSSYDSTPFFVYDPAKYRKSNLVDKNLKMPTMQEIAISLKHADGANGVWSVAFNRRRWKNFADDFRRLQPNPVDSNDLIIVETKNDSSLIRKYWGMEFQYQKQLTTEFSLGGNVTLSELQGNYEGGQVGTTESINNFGPLGGEPGAFAGAPTREQLAPYGNLAADVPVRIRLTSNYIMAIGKGRLNLGMIGSYTSGASYSLVTPGAPLAAGVPTAFGSTYTRYYSQRGAQRFPDTYRLDLQVAYDVSLWKKASFFTQVNFINFPNHQLQTGWNTTQTTVAGAWRGGANYGRPRTSNDYALARTVTVSAGIKF